MAIYIGQSLINFTLFGFLSSPNFGLPSWIRILIHLFMIVPKVWIQKKLCLWFIGFARNSIHLYCTCKKRERKEERQKLTEFSWSNVPSGKRKNSCYLLLVVNGQSGRMPSSDHIVPPTSLPETITLLLSNIFSSIFACRG